ncbi:uncharacterized protein M6B38_191030 [Iris pallida]|uniref:Telomere-associated protein Rif1 N-terminal domain-containing protein n=1 Tax=Iris pallida TaxID=29817 RepID=A0AAX6EF32_IRIPA|nr:uncharacterized protein M6B38_191030 [Iris pallida]
MPSTIPSVPSPLRSRQFRKAVTKLATQFCEKMRGISSVWAPPIYRRLISSDKKERDMAERCLLKTKSVLYPPSFVLSKAVKSDLEKKLLPCMLHMLLDHQQKVHMIRAWGSYVFLLDSSLLKNRHLINEMLKIPEKTFTDPCPQVQIASLVAWEHLINALLPAQEIEIEISYCDQVTDLLRRIKVLLMPLKGIILSNCDISVRLLALETWQYLLYKLGLSVNHPSVIMASFWPIVEAVFSRGPGIIRSISLWTSCLDLLDDYIMSKVRSGEMEQSAEKFPFSIVDKPTSDVPSINSKGSSKEVPIKWLPWKISHLDFHLKIVRVILSQGFVATVSPENRKFAFSSSLRIFRSVLQGVQVELKKLSTHYDDIQFCLSIIIKFTKEACEDIVSKQCADQFDDFLRPALQFVEAVKEKLDSSILASPLYPVSLDLKYIKDMQSSEKTVSLMIEPFPVGSLLYMDKVSPMVYTTLLHLCLIADCIESLPMPETDDTLRAMQNSNLLVFSVNPLVNLQASVSFMYMLLGKSVNGKFCWLLMWRIIANGLRDVINSGFSFSKNETDGDRTKLVYWFLCYPFVMLLHPVALVPENVSSCSDVCLVSSCRDIELDRVVEVWESLLDSFICSSQNKYSSLNHHAECMSQILISVVDENSDFMMQYYTESSLGKSQNIDLLSVFGDIVICILKHTSVLDAATSGSEIFSQEGYSQYRCSPITNCLRLAARFMELAVKVVQKSPQADHAVVCRFYASMTCFVGHIGSKQDILLLMESISNPLVQWLSFFASISGEMQQKSSIIYQLQCLWTQILDCLRRCQPPIIFDSLFLEEQASLLQASLAHSHHPISDSTIGFWNATYGQDVNLQYPQCLCPVLDKLSRSGRMSLQKGNSVSSLSRGSPAANVTGLSKKRMPAVEGSDSSRVGVDIVTADWRTKMSKMAEHPRKKGVESKHICCNGEYEYFKGKRELKKADYILEMLRKPT